MCKIFLLTAFLFLFFSCSQKSTDFVKSNVYELHETLFRSNYETIKRGEYFKFNFESQFGPETLENSSRLSKLRAMYGQIMKIDGHCAEMIRKIDHLKMDLLKSNGENIAFKTSDKNDESKVIWSEYDARNPLLPIHLNLKAIDVIKLPRNNLLVKDSKPSSAGQQLWRDFNNYRAAIVNLTATYQLGETAFSLDVKPINAFRDMNDLSGKVQQMVESGNVNLKEDAQVLQDLYINLTKQEKDAQGVHWIVSQFEDLPLVAQLNNLSILQHEILHARTMALAHISSKFMHCGNTLFTEVKFKVLAPEKAKRNEEVKMHVFLAAYEYFLEPTFTCDQGEIESYKEGIAVLKIKTDGQKEMKLSGTVSFELPYGDQAVLPWEKTVRIED